MPERNNTKPPYSLVEMLRLIPRSSLPIGVAWNKCEEAADLIETQAARIAELEKALRSIVVYCDDPYLPYYKDILSKACAAVEGGKK